MDQANDSKVRFEAKTGLESFFVFLRLMLGKRLKFGNTGITVFTEDYKFTQMLVTQALNYRNGLVHSAFIKFVIDNIFRIFMDDVDMMNAVSDDVNDPAYQASLFLRDIHHLVHGNRISPL
jgi:hypothetical protein